MSPSAAALFLASLALSCICPAAYASVTVYGISGVQEPLFPTSPSDPSPTVAPPSFAPTNLPAFNQLVLQPPPVPVPPPPTQFGIGLQQNADNLVLGGGLLSVRQNGSFLGFSVEFSVVDQISEFACSHHTQKHAADGPLLQLESIRTFSGRYYPLDSSLTGMQHVYQSTFP